MDFMKKYEYWLNSDSIDEKDKEVTAYLLTDRFKTLAIIAVTLGVFSSAMGVYLSYFLDGATGGVIVCIQTALFLLAFIFSPKYGLIRQRKPITKEEVQQ